MSFNLGHAALESSEVINGPILQNKNNYRKFVKQYIFGKMQKVVLGSLS